MKKSDIMGLTKIKIIGATQIEILEEKTNRWLLENGDNIYIHEIKTFYDNFTYLLIIYSEV